MAVRHGYGKIAGADALVFAYDTKDTRNSYKGEPTVNLLNYTTEFNSWTKATNSGTLPTVTSDTSPNPLGLSNAPLADKLYIPDDGTYPRIQQYFTPSSTNQHTMSVWIRSLSGNCDCFLGIFRNSPWSLPGYTVVSVTSEWQRFYFTMTPPDTTTHVAYIGSHDTAAQKGNTLELWGAMIEENSHKTPFTAGTRSVTQGLLDLTGNYSIDISNMSFDSNADIYSDGSNDIITISNDILNSGNEISLEFWITNHIMWGSSTVLIYGANSGNQCINIHLPWSNGYIYWDCGNSGQANLGDRINKQISQTDLEASRHWVFTKNATSGRMEIYKDGELWHSGTGKTRTMTGIDTSTLFNLAALGYDWGGSPDSVKIYRRELTAAEVRNNYNVGRSKYA